MRTLTIGDQPLLAARRSYRNEVLADGPLAFWMLDDASGTTAGDASGNGRTGTYTNGPTLAQASIIPTTTDTCVSFDGSNDSVDVASASWMDVSSITVEAVVNLPLSGTRAIVSRDNNTQRDWYLALSGADLYWGVRNASNALVEVGPVTLLAANTSTHIACTFSAGGTAKVYVNGAEASSSAVSGNLRTASAAIRVGAYLNISGYLNGKAQGVAIHGAALSAARILAHAHATGLG